MDCRKICAFASIVLLGIALVPLANGVETTGTILGTVRDLTGAAIPNAKITITNEGTGVARVVTSGPTGEYTVTLLPVGRYQLSAEADGFQSYVQRGIVLAVNQNARIDVELKPGSVSEKIEVQANASQVESTIATVGKVVEERPIVDLPLNGRNFLQLGVLQPGVNPITPNLAKSGSGAASDQGFNVNGLRTQANVFMVDGGLDTDLFFTSSVLKPPPDAIQEFKILTNSYSAEFWGGGSVVNVVTKAGTNSFHGAAWEFLRNDFFDARDFFSRKGITPIPALKQNQFGASAGGPVIIPGIYNGRNKTFFYAYYEGFRQRRGLTQTAGVPSNLERQGDFSQSARKPIDPSTGARFPGDRVPINSISAKLLALYPTANSGVNQFVASPSQSDDRNGFGVRIDHNFSQSDMLWGRYLQNNQEIIQPFVPFGATVPGFPGLANQKPKTVTVGETHIFNPELLNDLRLSYVRLNFGSPLFTRRDKLSDFGFTYAPTAPEFETVPVIQITGLSSLGNPQGPGIRVTNTYEIRDSLAWAKGRHDAKFGVDLRHTVYNITFGGGMSGQFTFNGQFTGVALADFLLGRPSNFSQNIVRSGHLSGSTYEFYGQDNFRLFPNLTLNFGIRYTVATAFKTLNRELFGAFRPGRTSSLRPDAPVGLVYQGDPGVPDGTFDTDNNNVAPRIGFAWDPTGAGKWSVRGGYGVFFEYIPGIAQFNAAFSSPPAAPSFSSNNVTNYANPLAGSTNPFAARSITTPVGLTSLAENLVMPYDQQWNLSVQRQMPADVLLEAAYIGTRGVKLLRFNQANPAVFNPGTALCPTPVNLAAVTTCRNNTDRRRIFAPNFRAITQVENSASSNFNSLQLSANKRFSSGLSFLASYTWSKAIDDASYLNISQGTNPGNVNPPMVPSNPALDRGPSLFDVRHRFVLSGIYDLPVGRQFSGVPGALLKGWQVNWILQLQSGTPFTVLEPTDVSLTGVGADRPNITCNPNSGPRSVAEWFETSCIQRLDPVANAGQFGNERRNSVVGPPYKNLDLSLMKYFPVTEQVRVQFRTEAFNILNHPNFNIPDHILGSARFGQLIEARDPRILQLGLKVLF